ncbi:unnamed protein product [marine sediment metagenome]|uniref:Uncharacterized protein n=1 Tax=marine sediment metagenome TaxID=412755 RepID=X0UF66_9ZZZZ
MYDCAGEKTRIDEFLSIKNKKKQKKTKKNKKKQKKPKNQKKPPKNLFNMKTQKQKIEVLWFDK